MFVRRSARHPSPVIELHLLRRPIFATATAANVVFGTAFGAMLLLVTLWCQDVWGWSALRTGLGVAPGPLLVPFWSIAAGPLARRIGPGPVAAAGCAIYAAGCVFWRLNLSVTPDYAAHMLPGMLLTGTGVGLTLPTLVSAAVSAVPPYRFATGSGIVTMARQVGIVLGVSILVTVLGHPAGRGCAARVPARHRGPRRHRVRRGARRPPAHPRPPPRACASRAPLPALSAKAHPGELAPAAEQLIERRRQVPVAAGRPVCDPAVAPAGRARTGPQASRPSSSGSMSARRPDAVQAQPAGDPDRPQERHVVAHHDERAR